MSDPTTETTEDGQKAMSVRMPRALVAEIDRLVALNQRRPLARLRREVKIDRAKIVREAIWAGLAVIDAAWKAEGTVTPLDNPSEKQE